MNTEWRLANDWIHRDQHDQLLSPLVAIQSCAKRNMRDKTECTAFAVKEHFETEIIPKLDRMKSVIPDASLLKEVSQLEFISNSFNHVTLFSAHSASIAC